MLAGSRNDMRMAIGCLHANSQMRNCEKCRKTLNKEKNAAFYDKHRLIQTRQFRTLGSSNVGGLKVSSAQGGLL